MNIKRIFRRQAVPTTLPRAPWSPPSDGRSPREETDDFECDPDHDFCGC